MKRGVVAVAVGVGLIAGAWVEPAGADHCEADAADSDAPIAALIGYPDQWDDWDLDGDCFLSVEEGMELSDGDLDDFRTWVQLQMDENDVSTSEMESWLSQVSFDNESPFGSLGSELGIAGEPWPDAGAESDDDAESEDSTVSGDGAAGSGAGRSGFEPATGTQNGAGVSSDVAEESFESIANSVGEAAGSLTGWVAGELADPETPGQLSADWYQRHYQRMLGWSGLIMVPLAMVAIGAAVLRGDTSRIGETFLEIPAVYLLGVVAIGLVSASAGLAQTMAQTLAGDITDSSEELAANVSGLLTVSGGMSSGIVLVLGLVIAITALTTAVWLILTEAAIYGVVLFIPLAFAGRVWPRSPAAGWGRKLLTFAFALVAAKVVIFGLWALTVDGLASATDAVSFSGGASGSEESVPLRAAIATAALLLMMAASPAVVLRLVPMAESVGAGAEAGGAVGRNVTATPQGDARVVGAFAGGGRSGGAGGGGHLRVSDGSGGGGCKAPPDSTGPGKGGDSPALRQKPKRDKSASGGSDSSGGDGGPSTPAPSSQPHGARDSEPKDGGGGDGEVVPGHPVPEDAGDGKPW